MTFAFDEQFAMFDITPVENQFILEYLPGAKGDYVKVYLYGLLCCYHPKKEMDAGSMSRELGMTEEEILTAFRYWERRGIVRRIQDHPPAWQYINIKQKTFAGDEPVDTEYVQFCRELESCFDGIRDFHGSEIAACYEWKEDLHLSQEVILMLLKYMVRTRGKHFRIKDAEKTAMMLSDEKAFTAEEAEQVLERDEAMNAGFRKVLRKMGKRYNPSDANLMLYRKWVQEWHFTQEAIEDACDRTGTSDPSLALVDSILEQAYRSRGETDRPLGKAELDAYEQERKNLKQVLSEAGQYGPVTAAQRKLYKQMTEMYPQEIILIAARECGTKRHSFDSVLRLLESWKERGFRREEDIREHIEAFHEKEEYLRSLRRKWTSRDAETGQKTLQMLDKWESELGFSREMITMAAELAFESKKPVSYMDKILTGWAEKGIRTPEEAGKEIRERRGKTAETQGRSGGKGVTAQQYEQRDYSGEQEEAMQRMLSMNGGDGHA